MLTSPGWRARTSQTVTLFAFSGGIFAGAALSGFALWLVSGVAEPIPTTVVQVVVVIAAAIALLRDSNFLHLQLPENRRLIPAEVFHKGPVKAAVQFGFELGTGVRTYLPSSGPYVLALAIILLAPDVTTAAVAAYGFALGRATMPWLRYVSVDKTAWDELLSRRASPIVRISALGTCAASVAVILI